MPQADFSGRRPPGETFKPKAPKKKSKLNPDGTQSASAEFDAAFEKAALGPGRVKNAIELRQNYADIANSPDGADPFPLTMPRCVECAHCGWPVFVRDCKIATNKTYERAGVDRKGNKVEEQKPGAGGGGGAEGEQNGGEAAGAQVEEDDDDSKDTIEKQADEIEELSDKVNELEGEVKWLKEENVRLTAEVEELTEAFVQAEEKIEQLQEQEQRWIDKYTMQRQENTRLVQRIERICFKSEDMETALKNFIMETRRLEKDLAATRRRRRLMLEELAVEIGRRETSGLLHTLFSMWARKASSDSLFQVIHEVDLRRQRETTELQETVDVERDKVSLLEGLVDGLKAKLRDAGTRFLGRAMGTAAWPWAKAYAVCAWTNVTPLLATENELERTQKLLAETQEKLEFQTARADRLEAERAVLVEERDALIVERDALTEELEFLQSKFDDSKLGNMKEVETMRKALKEELRKAIAAVEERLRLAQEEWDEDRATLELQIEQLSSKLRLSEAKAAAGGNTGSVEVDDSYRVVPKGQGVVCVGCMKQLVHRSVKPLPPLGAITASSEFLEASQKAFITSELDGMLNPDDALHRAAFNERADPYNVSKLCIWPPGEVPTKSTCTPTSTWGSRSASQLTSPKSQLSSRSWSPKSQPVSPKMAQSAELLPGIPKKRTLNSVKKEMNFKPATGFR